MKEWLLPLYSPSIMLKMHNLANEKDGYVRFA
jgi:hypothetical protein